MKTKIKPITPARLAGWIVATFAVFYGSTFYFFGLPFFEGSFAAFWLTLGSSILYIRFGAKRIITEIARRQALEELERDARVALGEDAGSTAADILAQAATAGNATAEEVAQIAQRLATNPD